MGLFPSVPLVLLLAHLVTGLDQDLQGLRLVHLVYRHGDRTPVDPYPTDPYKDPMFWPVGFGQLTNRGKQRHYDLGQWIKSRYSGFLSEEYDPEEIFIRSTDVDRTLMSAQSNLAGLFPPSSKQKWNKKLAWQPIPVHTVPQTEDALLSSHADCPRFAKLQAELLVSQDFRDIYEENRELFEYVSKHSGWNITDIVNLNYLHDTLFIEHDNNFTLPDWTKKVFPGGKFKELSDLSFIVDTYTPELKRLKGGPFLKKMLDDSFKALRGEINPAKRKMFMYSGHDTTVAPILYTLDVFNPPISPAYASMIIFEVFQRETNYIRVSFKNETDRPPYVLSIPGCTDLCPINRFQELVSPMIPGNWREECGFDTHNQLEKRITLIAAMSSTLMAVVVLLAVVFLVCRKKKEGDVRYERIGRRP